MKKQGDKQVLVRNNRLNSIQIILTVLIKIIAIYLKYFKKKFKNQALGDYF